MLLVWKRALAGKRIVLASASPRRKEILQKLGGLNGVETIPSSFEEDLDKSKYAAVQDYVIATATAKVMQVAKEEHENLEAEPPFLVIGADTVVSMDGVIYEKPRDRAHAIDMISGFSGRVHQVYTGVVLLLLRDGYSRDLPVDVCYSVRSFHEITDVHMADLSPDVVEAYVDSGESMDKAGGYGIQSLGAQLVRGIKGDYPNVVGFPLHSFCAHLGAMLGSG